MPRKMTPAQTWALATRVYHDFEKPQTERERDWLTRASRAYAAGNWLHLPRIVDVCDLLQIPPPELLAAALVPIVRAAATGEKLSAERGGRHANLARQMAEDVLAVESLMVFEVQRGLLAPSGAVAFEFAAKKRGRDALDAAAAYFGVSAGPVSRGYHRPRSRELLDGHVKKARKLLRDPRMSVRRERIAANFPPRVLAALALDRRKPA